MILVYEWWESRVEKVSKYKVSELKTAQTLAEAYQDEIIDERVKYFNK